jgi:hypothetical protein
MLIKTPMRVSILVTIGVCAALSARTAGAEPDGTSDPFAEYRESLDRQLTAAMKNREVPPDKAATEKEAELVSSDVAGKATLFPAPLREGVQNDLVLALERLNPIRGTLEKILESEGVPKQLLAVVLVESAAQPFALSKRHARGLWQFMPETARQYGLQVGPDRDDRVDMERASRAAGWYLRELYCRFENWPLALAAYNAGPEAVQRALARSKANTFWQLSAGRQLPEETRKYVPAVLAAAKLFNLSPLQQNGLFQSPAVSIYALSAPTE